MPTAAWSDVDEAARSGDDEAAAAAAAPEEEVDVDVEEEGRQEQDGRGEAQSGQRRERRSRRHAGQTPWSGADGWRRHRPSSSAVSDQPW